jgi:O-antigen/teichoic acid export membrane protein
MIFVGSGLRVVVSADVRHDYSFGAYFETRTILNFAGLIIIAFFALVSDYASETVIVVILIGFTKFVEGLQEICWGVSQRHEKMGQVGISRIMRAFGMTIALALGVGLANDLITGGILWLVCWTIILLVYDLPRARILEKLSLEYRPAVWKKIIVLAAPLAIVWGTLAFNDRVSQYLLSWFQGEEAVGYFGPLSYIIQAGGLALASVSESMIPRLSTFHDTDKTNFIWGGLKLSGVGAIIGIVLFVGSLIFGERFLILVYQPEYAQYANVFITLMGFAILRFAMNGMGSAITAAGYFRIQIPIFLIGLLTTLVSGWVLIPRWGLLGAAWSNGVGITSSLILLSFVFHNISQRLESP